MREAERIEPGSAVNAGRATPQRTHYIHPGEDFWARIREYCASMWPPTTPAPARRGTTPSCPTNASALAEFAAATLGIAGALLNAIDLAAASYLVWLPGNAAGLFSASPTPDAPDACPSPSCSPPTSSSHSSTCLPGARYD